MTKVPLKFDPVAVFKSAPSAVVMVAFSNASKSARTGTQRPRTEKKQHMENTENSTQLGSGRKSEGHTASNNTKDSSWRAQTIVISCRHLLVCSVAQRNNSPKETNQAHRELNIRSVCRYHFQAFLYMYSLAGGSRQMSYGQTKAYPHTTISKINFFVKVRSATFDRPSDSY